VEAELLEGVEHERDRGGAEALDEVGDDLVDVALSQRAVDELVVVGVELVAEGVGEAALDAVVEDDPADGRQEVLVAGTPVLGVVVELDELVLVRQLGLLRGAEAARAL
jgi:hypothetical protein